MTRPIAAALLIAAACWLLQWQPTGPFAINGRIAIGEPGQCLVERRVW